jgi:hypothetical protein
VLVTACPRPADDLRAVDAIPVQDVIEVWDSRRRRSEPVRISEEETAAGKTATLVFFSHIIEMKNGRVSKINTAKCPSTGTKGTGRRVSEDSDSGSRAGFGPSPTLTSGL